MEIVFTTSRSWVSRLIQWFDGSETSHVGIRYHSATLDRVFVLDANIRGVTLTPNDKWLRNRRVVARFQPRTEYARAFLSGLQHAVGHVGERYDLVGLIGFAWVVLAWRWLGRKMRNPLAATGAMVCSELVVHLREPDHIPELEGLDPETTSPRRLLEVLRGGPSFEEIA